MRGKFKRMVIPMLILAMMLSAVPTPTIIIDDVMNPQGTIVVEMYGHPVQAAQADMNKVQKDYSVKVFIDSKDNQVVFPQGMGKPFIAQNRTFVPYRILAERMGSQVGWDGSQNKVTAMSKESSKVEMFIGNQVCKVDGENVRMDVEPFVLSAESRTYVPARFLTEGLGYTIDFTKGEKVMYICSFTQGQTEAQRKAVLQDIVQKEEGQVKPVASNSDKVIVEDNEFGGKHYIIGANANERFNGDKYKIKKNDDCFGTGADVLTIWPRQSPTIQLTCTNHPEFNTLDYYGGGDDDMTGPRKQYQLKGIGYDIQAEKGMVLDFKSSDGDTFTVTL